MSISTVESLEKRVVAIEEALIRLQQQLEARATGKLHGFESMIGMFENEPEFDKVVEYGRLIRKGEMEVPGIDP